MDTIVSGHLEDAVACIGKALNRAQELSNPYGSAFSLHVNCLFNQVRRDWRAVQEQSALLVALAAEQGFPHFVAMGTFFQGWAAFTSGDTETGIALMHEGLAASGRGSGDPGALLSRPARRCVSTGSPGARCAAAADGCLGTVERTGERWFEAELHRMKAEVLMASLRRGMLPQRRKPRFTVLLRLPTRRVRNCGSCERLPALRSCGATKVDASRRAACSRPFSAGSSRASTHQIWMQQGPCFTPQLNGCWN